MAVVSIQVSARGFATRKHTSQSAVALGVCLVSLFASPQTAITVVRPGSLFHPSWCAGTAAPASLLHNVALPSVPASRCAKAPLGAGHRFAPYRVKATDFMQRGLRAVWWRAYLWFCRGLRRLSFQAVGHPYVSAPAHPGGVALRASSLLARTHPPPRGAPFLTRATHPHAAPPPVQQGATGQRRALRAPRPLCSRARIGPQIFWRSHDGHARRNRQTTPHSVRLVVRKKN